VPVASSGRSTAGIRIRPPPSCSDCSGALSAGRASRWPDTTCGMPGSGPNQTWASSLGVARVSCSYRTEPLPRPELSNVDASDFARMRNVLTEPTLSCIVPAAAPVSAQVLRVSAGVQDRDESDDSFSLLRHGRQLCANKLAQLLIIWSAAVVPLHLITARSTSSASIPLPSAPFFDVAAHHIRLDPISSISFVGSPNRTFPLFTGAAGSDGLAHCMLMYCARFFGHKLALTRPVRRPRDRDEPAPGSGSHGARRATARCRS
jgi:hypothetical protein